MELPRHVIDQTGISYRLDFTDNETAGQPKNNTVKACAFTYYLVIVVPFPPFKIISTSEFLTLTINVNFNSIHFATVIFFKLRFQFFSKCNSLRRNLISVLLCRHNNCSFSLTIASRFYSNSQVLFLRRIKSTLYRHMFTPDAVDLQRQRLFPLLILYLITFSLFDKRSFSVFFFLCVCDFWQPLLRIHSLQFKQPMFFLLSFGVNYLKLFPLIPLIDFCITEIKCMLFIILIVAREFVISENVYMCFSKPYLSKKCIFGTLLLSFRVKM